MLSADDVARVAARVRAESVSDHVPMAALTHPSATVRLGQAMHDVLERRLRGAAGFGLAADVEAEARSLVLARGLALAWSAARLALASGRSAAVRGARAMITNNE